MSNNKQSGDVLVNIDEASKITNYSLHTLYQKVSQNQIPYIKKTGEKRLWFNKEELLNYRKKPSQNKKNKVKNECRDSEKLKYAQKVIIMLGMLEQLKTSPILKPFRTTNLDYRTTKQNQTIKTMTNNKQSSSIDFFWNQLPEILPFTVDTETAVKLLEAFQQAKSMHRQEHGKTWDESMDNFIARGENYVRAYVDFEDYYAETFGGNNEQQ